MANNHKPSVLFDQLRFQTQLRYLVRTHGVDTALEIVRRCIEREIPHEIPDHDLERD